MKKFVVDWSRYTGQQINLVMMLDRILPIHESIIRRKGVKTNTIESLRYGLNN